MDDTKPQFSDEAYKFAELAIKIWTPPERTFEKNDIDRYRCAISDVLTLLQEAENVLNLRRGIYPPNHPLNPHYVKP